MPIRRPTREALVDIALGAAVTASLSVTISADQGGERSADPLAYAWAAGLGLLMLARRRHPRTVVAVSVLGVIAYFAAGYPAVPISLTIAAPLFSAAERRRVPFAIGAAALLVAVSITARLIEGQPIAVVVGYELASHVALMGVAILLGVMVRLRRDAEASRERVVELQERERELHVAQAVREERIAIARELHDSIGHALTLVAIQANVADETLATDPARARGAIADVKAAASGSLHELRSTVGLLRADVGSPLEAPAAPLAALLDAAADSRIDVERDVRLDDVPGYASTAAQRIAQEAVANALRHATPTRIAVRIGRAGDTVEVHVENDGVSRAATRASAGLGIPGMRERAEALGGRLEAAPHGSRFVVAAVIPLGAR